MGPACCASMDMKVCVEGGMMDGVVRVPSWTGVASVSGGYEYG